MSETQYIVFVFSLSAVIGTIMSKSIIYVAEAKNFDIAKEMAMAKALELWPMAEGWSYHDWSSVVALVSDSPMRDYDLSCFE